MSTEQHVEPLSGGLVTSKDPAALASGELTLANNSIYLPNDESIQRVRGRLEFGNPAGGTVKGLRYLAFDGASSLLVAYAGTTYFSAPMTTLETGAFSTLATGVGSGLTLEAIQYNNRHYLLNGAGSTNQVVIEGGTTRTHGLKPVPDPPTLALVTGAWNTALGTGYYFVITTEVLNNDLESTNTVPPLLVPSQLISSADISSKSIQVTKPITTNSNATTWRIYIAGPYPGAQPTPPLSDFFLAGEQDIGTTTALIGNLVVNGPKFPTANTVITVGWANPNNAHANDNVATITTTSGAAELWRTFGFGASGTIQGIEVLVKYRIPNGNFLLGTLSRVNMSIALTKNADAGSPTYTTARTEAIGGPALNFVQIATGQGYVVKSFGGPTDLWGTSWTAADVNANGGATNFGVSITVNRFSTLSMVEVDIDYVQIKVYTVGTSSSIPFSFGAPFPTISISVGGIESVIGSNGVPPVASTGDIYEDQMVTNDVSDLSLIRYSLPTAVDYFPSIYFVNFETKTTDIVTNIGRLGNTLLVGMKNNIFRVNYLPRETDAEFDRGRCYEALVEGLGIVGTQAAVNFSIPGGPLMRAVVAYSGLHVTDGLQVDSWSRDLDWYGTVSTPETASGTDYLQNCILVDYPKNYQIWLYYTPIGATTNTKAFVFHYHPTQRKENGQPKITGPVDVDGASATLGRVSNMPVLMTGQTDGKVYVEDRAYLASMQFAVRTREIYLGGLGRAVTVNTAFVRHRADTTSTITVLPRTRFGAEAQVNIATKTFTTTNGGAAEVPFGFAAESMDFKLSEEAVIGTNAIRLTGIALEVVSTGLAERRT